MNRCLSAIGLASALTLGVGCSASETPPVKLPTQAIIVAARPSSFQQYRLVTECGPHVTTGVDGNGKITTGITASCEEVTQKAKKLSTTVLKLAACHQEDTRPVLADADYFKNSALYPSDYRVIGNGQTSEGIQCGMTVEVITGRVAAIAVRTVVEVAQLQHVQPNKYVS